MRREVDSVVGFISNLLIQRKLPSELAHSFLETLRELLCNHYQNHWFPNLPFKGNAYRCLRMVGGQVDPLFAQAGQAVGLTTDRLLDLLPRELTIWVDPEDVSYRIGEEGSIGVLFEGKVGLPAVEQDTPHVAKLKSCKEQAIILHQSPSSHSNAEPIMAS